MMSSDKLFHPKVIIVAVAALGLLLIWFTLAKEVTSQNNVFELVQDMDQKATFHFNEPVFGTLSDSVTLYRFQIYDPESAGPGLSLIRQAAPEIPIIITIAPWGSRISNYQDNSLRDIIAGHYDRLLTDFCTALPADRQNIYLRFAPEMEVPAGKYAWQQYPDIYIKAYRHFAMISRKYAPGAQLVWAPAGYPGALEYYPGEDVVDAASVTILATSEASLTAYPRLPIDRDLRRRLHRLRNVGVPILVLANRKELVRDAVVLAADYIVKNQEVYATLPGKISPPHTSFPSVDKLLFGLYDPNDLLTGHKDVDIEHLFADFSSLVDGRFGQQFNAVVSRAHDVIVTFEPFRLPDGTVDTLVLEHLAAGQYDFYLSKLRGLLASTNQKVYLRYAHEMEIPIHRYPWQSREPVIYIRSFRYFMEQFEDLPNIFRVWGPAGDRGSLEWYPGDGWVDYLSIAIYGLPDKNITDPRKQEKFETIFRRKTWRLRFVNKPLFITEFGVKGPDDYQSEWLVAAARTVRKASNVIGINYFNMSDTPKAWGEIKPPDWSISRKTLETFVDELDGFGSEGIPR